MKIAIAILIAGLLIAGSIVLTKNNSISQQPNKVAENIPNVSIVNGTQIIEIRAKGGYTPRISVARAGIPTTLRFNTNGTFDCSASVRLPSMGISEILPNSGTKDISLGSPKAGTLQGTCGMGMYPFEIQFQS